MSIQTMNHAPMAGSLPGYFSALRENFAAQFRRARAYDRTYSELDVMTDRELADIGLHRGMIGDIAAESAARA